MTPEQFLSDNGLPAGAIEFPANKIALAGMSLAQLRALRWFYNYPAIAAPEAALRDAVTDFVIGDAGRYGS